MYNILIEFDTPMKLLRLIKMYLNGNCRKALIGKRIPFGVI